MAEANDDTLEPVAAPAADDDDDDVPKVPIDDRPKTINDLPKELLVSAYEAVDDLRYVRHTVPLVCKAWDELYRSQDASPLHETLEVDLLKEALEAQKRFQDPSPFVRASRVISWVERRAGWVRKLFWKGEYPYYTKGFSAEDLGRLVAVAGSSLTELRIRCAQDRLLQKPFWDSLRDSVVPAGLLHSLVVMGPFVVASKFDVEPLGQLAGSLEELALSTLHSGDDGSHKQESGLPRFPESFRALTELRHLELVGHARIKAISAKISSLKELQVLDLACCRLSSLPKELGELSGLTDLKRAGNMHLGNAPQDEAFPAELGKLKSLRVLDLSHCGLRTVPSFVGGLQSLEVLNLAEHVDLQVDATFELLIEGCPRLRELILPKGTSTQPWTPESRAHLKARLHSEARGNPKRQCPSSESEAFSILSPPRVFCFFLAQSFESARREGLCFFVSLE